MNNWNHRLLFIALIGLTLTPGSAAAQDSTKKPQPAAITQTRADLISATEAYKNSAQEVVKFQEDEIAASTKKLEQLKQLVAEGLVARNELAAAADELAAAQAKFERTKKQIFDSDDLVAQIKQAEGTEKVLAKSRATQAAASKKLLLPTSMRYNGMAGWALANISSVQSFFSATFGKPLPISSFGQSATHNAMHWDHRNSADVSIHPDSVEGKALIAYLQSKGIPFLAFRGAIPGVATGPHIHIGYPSSRMS